MKQEKPNSSDEPPIYFPNTFAEYVPPEQIPGMDFTHCKKCKSHVGVKRLLRILNTNCANCKYPIKVAFVSIEEIELFLPNSFTRLERKLAKQRGVHLKKCENCYAPGDYSNFCRNCKTPTEFYSLIYPILNFKPECNVVSGYICETCD